MHHQHQPDQIPNFPETVETADAKLVYLYLHQEQEATIDELQAALRIQKIALYPLLRRLTATDHVDRSGEQYICNQSTSTGGNQ